MVKFHDKKEKKKEERPKVQRNMTPRVYPYEYDDDKFTRWTESKSLDALKKVLNMFKAEKGFYKKILEEPYREKHPESYRYKHAKEKLVNINTRGKQLSEIIKSKENG